MTNGQRAGGPPADGRIEVARHGQIEQELAEIARHRETERSAGAEADAHVWAELLLADPVDWSREKIEAAEKKQKAQ